MKNEVVIRDVLMDRFYTVRSKNKAVIDESFINSKLGYIGVVVYIDCGVEYRIYSANNNIATMVLRTKEKDIYEKSLAVLLATIDLL